MYILNRAINIFAPLEKLSRFQRRLKMKPWITRELFKSIKTKQKLYSTHFIPVNQMKNKIIKKQAIQLNRIKVASKKLFNQSTLEKSKCKTQLMRRTIKSLLSSSSSSSLPQTLKLDVSFTPDPKPMVEGFNNYFSEVGPLVADKIESSNENTLRLIRQKEYLHRFFSTQQSCRNF